MAQVLKLPEIETIGHGNSDWLKDIDLDKPGGREGIELAGAVLRGSQNFLRDAQAELAGVAKNERLSKVGIAQERKAVGEKSLTKIAGYRQALKRVAEGRDKRVAALKPKLAGDENAVAVQFAAIWPRLSDNPGTVAKLHATALAEGDTLTAAAIEALPVAFPGRPTTARIAQLRRRRIKVEQPEAAEALVKLDQAVSDTQFTLDSVENELRKCAGLPAFVWPQTTEPPESDPAMEDAGDELEATLGARGMVGGNLHTIDQAAMDAAVREEMADSREMTNIMSGDAAQGE